MNKFKLAIALGTGLTLGVAAPSAVRAGASATTTPTAETISTANMSAAEFNQLFTPVTNSTQSSTISFYGAPNAGTLTSQVFAGGKDAANGIDATGLYAYAYQISTNKTTDANGQPVHISAAEYQFNATPTGTALGTGGQTVFGYTVADGKVGDFAMPTSASGGAAPVPSTLAWQPGTKTGSVLASFNTGTTGELSGGDTSATYVVLSTQPPSSNLTSAGVLSSLSQTSVNLVNTPTDGAIQAIPSPEPTTVLAWAGMAGAVALVRRTRKARNA